MSRHDYYSAEPWEVFDLVELGIRKENEETKQKFHIMRTQMSAMADVSELVFEWELKERAKQDLEQAEARKVMLKRLIEMNNANVLKRQKQKAK